jgi:putative membrane protein
VGSEPDYRFTLANERTYLAWIRTALALAAGGLGTITVIDTFYGQELLGLMLLGLSFITAATSYRRWSANERSIRLERPLPPSILPQVMTIGTALVAIAASVLVIVGKL